MTTTVVKTIGTASRDYSTLQAWEDASPANLVTADQIWKGECYKDSTFTVGLSISGITTDATRYVWLTAAAGQSFADNPENALNYNAANGVTITVYDEPIVSSVANVKIDRLQTSGNRGITDTSGSSAVYIDNCILKTSHYTTGGGCVKTAGNVSNCVLINIGGGTAAIGYGSAKFFNVTAIQTGSASAFGFRGDYSTPKYTNCAAFGFGTNFRSGYDGTSDYNASSQASPPGAHSLGSLTFSDHFVSSSDYKLKATSTLINAGTATGAPSTDIFGTSRPSGAGYDIGAFEYVAAGGVTAVYSDAYTAYSIRGATNQDLSPAFSVRGATQTDISAAFNTRSAAQIDLLPAFDIRGAAQTDLLPAFSVRGAVQIDLSDTFNIRGVAQTNFASSYDLRGSAVANFSPAFNVRGATVADFSPAFNVRGLTQADGSASYSIRSAVGAEMTATYGIVNAGVVTADLSTVYQVRGIAQGDVVTAYSLRGSVQGNLTPSYVVRGAVVTDIAASYAVAGSVAAVQSDLTVSYSVFGVSVPCPTAADIAAAVRADLSAELARIDATISSRATVAGILGATVP